MIATLGLKMALWILGGSSKEPASSSNPLLYGFLLLMHILWGVRLLLPPLASRFPSSHKMHSLQSGCRSGDEERMTSKNPSVQPGNLQRLLMGFVRYGQWCSWRVQIILGFMAGGGEVVVSSSCATPRCTHACCLPVQRHSMGWGNCGHPS